MFFNRCMQNFCGVGVGIGVDDFFQRGVVLGKLYLIVDIAHTKRSYEIHGPPGWSLVYNISFKFQHFKQKKILVQKFYWNFENLHTKKNLKKYPWINYNFLWLPVLKLRLNITENFKIEEITVFWVVHILFHYNFLGKILSISSRSLCTIGYRVHINFLN